jgi:hypothetical protein
MFPTSCQHSFHESFEMTELEREDYRQAISLLLGTIDAREIFPRDVAVRFAWEVMERYSHAARASDAET